MGAIWLKATGLPSFVSELVGFKTGVCLAREQMVSLLKDSLESDDLFDVSENENVLVRVRSEEVEAAVHHLLFKLGNTPTPGPVHPAIALLHRYKGKPGKLKRATTVLEKWEDFMGQAVKEAIASKKKALDRTPFLEEMLEKRGPFEAKVALQLFEDFNTRLLQNPWNQVRTRDWTDVVQLRELFESESLQTQYGQFFDQRFIDYLYRNFDDIDKINWRKFEGLTGEFFDREGLHVELGPGRDDGNIDARIWPKKEAPEQPPAILVQCKRQKDSVSKVVVKALWADIVDEKAQSGLIVTTSMLSPGAQKVCTARGYPINSAERDTLRRWIQTMRSPGAGVFMGE